MKEGDEGWPLILVIVGIFILSGIGYIYLKNAGFEKNAIKTSATVVSKREQSFQHRWSVKAYLRHYAKLQFQDNSGKLRNFEMEVDHPKTYQGLRVGDRVLIRYDRRNPEDVRLRKA